MTSTKLIIIPAFNESTNIQHTITEIRNSSNGFDLVVIDDGSIDDTRARALAAGVEVISLPFNLGIGGAVQSGLMYARMRDYDFVIRLDADGQHAASDLKQLLGPLKDDLADMVIGSRFVGRALEGYTPGRTRRTGILYLSAIIRCLSGQRILDVTSGFCGWNRKGINLFADSYPVDFPEPESLVLAVRAGLRIMEVPVTMRQRYSGKSSISVLISFYYLIKVTFALLLMQLQRKGRRSL